MTGPCDGDTSTTEGGRFADDSPAHGAYSVDARYPETAMTTSASQGYELRFKFLFDNDRALAFPCDERGQVDLDRLPERSRNNYFYARVAVGRDFACPAVLARGAQE